MKDRDTAGLEKLIKEAIEARKKPMYRTLSFSSVQLWRQRTEKSTMDAI
jgi:hypothetical protein